jgi:hypothetical protein
MWLPAARQNTMLTPENTKAQVLDRSYIAMIRSKSKGSTMHLSQILLPLGQQAFGEEGCIGNMGANRTSAYQRPVRYGTFFDAKTVETIRHLYHYPQALREITTHQLKYAGSADIPIGADPSLAVGVLFHGPDVPPRVCRALRGNALFKRASWMMDSYEEDRLRNKGFNNQTGMLGGLAGVEFVNHAFCARASLVRIVTASSTVGHSMRLSSEMSKDVSLGHNGMVTALSSSRVIQLSRGNANTSPAFASGKGRFTDVGVIERMVKTAYRDHKSEQRRLQSVAANDM